MDEGKIEIIRSLLDMEITDTYFEFIKKDQAFANRIFDIESPLARGGYERLMISVMIDKPKKMINCADTLENIHESIKQVENIYKGFHIGKIKDPEAEVKFQELKVILEKGLADFENMKNELHYGNMLFLGLDQVGKTTLIKKITSGEFDAGTRPTLGTQVIKMMFDSMNFKVYDVGGQKAIRGMWYSAVKNPDAIIFLYDLTSNEDRYHETKVEFEKAVFKFYKENPSTPLLVLGSKTDLVDTEVCTNMMDQIKKFVKTFTQVENLHIGTISSKSNKGIVDNFKWLVRATLV
jgi:ADP-ribosylation factor-like protein 3